MYWDIRTKLLKKTWKYFTDCAPAPCVVSDTLTTCTEVSFAQTSGNHSMYKKYS